MGEANFSESELEGQSEVFSHAVAEIRTRFDFDFVSIGLTPYVGAPLRWIYSSGATSERHRRISLAPGHGIGGIVLKAGKPMMFADIDKELDAREYSSYPIVFAEDLRSFCALPLVGGGRTVGVLLCAFRTVDEGHIDAYRDLVAYLGGYLGGLEVVSRDFLDFDGIVREDESAAEEPPYAHSEVARVIEGQENERKRISRDLHDGVAQEVLAVVFTLRSLKGHVDEAYEPKLDEALAAIDRIIEELHDLSVTLRPATLDNLGLVPALRSQALLMQNRYGVKTEIQSSLARERFAPLLETQVYRICQEAMLNACKYSDADNLYVTLEDAGGWLHVSVVDHGVGFDTEKPVIKGSGCGLSGMRERASQIGGVLTMESGPGGTVVTLVAPMGSDDDENEEEGGEEA